MNSPDLRGLLEAGERVHLLDHKGRRYGLTLRTGAVFQHSGEMLRHDDVIGRPDGTAVVLSRGTRLTALRPTLAEYVLKMPRGAQIIYPKDLATILLWADIYPGARVLEAGIGSGALTLTLLRAVGEHGQVLSYELREDFLTVALANVELALGKVPPNLTASLKDVTEGIEDGRPHVIDRIVLDIPEPWRAVAACAEALRPGGLLLCYLPTVPQVAHLVEVLRAHGPFIMVETIEVLIRPWTIDGRSVRPDHRMVAHTGFITTARRIAPQADLPEPPVANHGDKEPVANHGDIEQEGLP